MRRLGNVLETVYDKSVTAANVVAVTLIFMVMLHITANVIGLFFFNYAVPGTVGVAKVMLPLIVFLSITYTQRHGGHVRTGVILDRLPPRGKAIINIVASGMGVLTFSLIATYSGELAWQSWLTGDFLDGVIRVPTYPSRFAVALGSVLITIQFALDLARSSMAVIRGSLRAC